MSSKKQSIEEKLSQSIFYNLNILKMAVKTSPDFDECLSMVILNFFIPGELKTLNIFATSLADNVLEVKYKSLYPHHTFSVQHS